LVRLDQADALGALAGLPLDRRIDHFLNRLEADGQLLPALLTARRGQSFEQILESVFEDIYESYGKETTEFLLRGYAGIALVHRFNFGMTRSLLSGFIGMTEDMITHRLLQPLQGELLEIGTGEEQLLYTRHPWIAEAALISLCGRYLPEDTYLYHDLYHALGNLLQSNPLSPERKLLSQLPQALKLRGNFKQARQLFKLAAEIDPKNALVYQAWAIMEKDAGDQERARDLFHQAAQANPKNPLYIRLVY
jgi:tetratricopeptide (TPR) repeat protein